MSASAITTEAVQPAPQAEPRKRTGHPGTKEPNRVAQLLSERNQLEKRIQDLARQLHGLEQQNETLRGDLHFHQEMLSRLKAEAETRQEPAPEAIAKVMAEGRRLFPADWDQIIAAMNPGPEIIAALARFPNGVAAVYALATGCLLLAHRREQVQAQAQQAEHYRQIWAKHFEGTTPAEGTK